MRATHDTALPFAYRLVVALGTPFLRLSRIEVSGAEHLPTSGPTLVVANHDSEWDPFAIGYAARSRRQIRALAKRSLWDNPVRARILDAMGQIPIERGAGGAALRLAERELRAGACIGIFPEGTRSLGRQLRARSGVGWLALAVPDAVIVCCRVRGTAGQLWRPGATRVRVEFFPPAGGQRQPDESAEHLAVRLLAEIRAGAPPVRPRRAALRPPPPGS